MTPSYMYYVCLFTFLFRCFYQSLSFFSSPYSSATLPFPYVLHYPTSPFVRPPPPPLPTSPLFSLSSSPPPSLLTSPSPLSPSLPPSPCHHHLSPPPSLLMSPSSLSSPSPQHNHCLDFQPVKTDTVIESAASLSPAGSHTTSQSPSSSLTHHHPSFVSFFFHPSPH